jgi:hypothetical protein
MSKYKSLAIDIIKNPGKYMVNREEKLNATMDVMIANAERKEMLRQSAPKSGVVENDRGYGRKGVRMGD